jgi:hypothetical protein
MLSWAKIVGFILIILAVSILGVYSYMCSNSSYSSSLETTTIYIHTSGGGVKVNVTTAERPSTFYGPELTGEVSGLKVVATLSNSSVRVGEILWIKVDCVGEKAYYVGEVMLTVINLKGEKVYAIVNVHPHATIGPGFTPPQEGVRELSWTAIKDPYFNVDVTPGNYKIVIEFNVSGEKIVLNGTVTVTLLD